MRYCSRCILPDTRPGITIDDHGVCSACAGHADKETRIDWPARAAAFQEIVASAKARSTGYDCIVALSGGKDSWYQVIRCQEAGLKVLGITWRTPGRTAVGQRNLDSMIAKLGIDHIDYSIDPDVERRFMKAAFTRKGISGLPMHMALFAIPLRLAVKLRIPLIVWGENPQLEYGGKEEERFATRLDRGWLAKHGCLFGTRPHDWVGAEGLTAQELTPYQLPDEAEFMTDSIFLGTFFKWNSFENARLAAARGFVSGSDYLKVGVWAFADLDCQFLSLHHFLKWYKFGFTRAFDNLSSQIRYGLLTRDEAVATLRKIGLQVPTADIAAFCEFLGEKEAWFWEVTEGFRNRDIWLNDKGKWRIPGFLIEDWTW